MNTKLLKLFCLSALSCLSYSTFAVNETEPNGNWNQAKNIPFTATGEGKISAGGDVDWWRVKSTTDGSLNLDVWYVGGSFSYSYELYDTLGTLLISTPFPPDYHGLRAGTYYIRIQTNNPADSTIYSVHVSWTNAPLANDVEPNSGKATAKVLPLNGSKTGHIGYYYYNSRDTADWYKITTTAHGDLAVTLAVQLGHNVSFDVFDNNGSTLLQGNATYDSYTINLNGLAPGTYYVRVTGFSSNDFDAYTLSDAFTPTPVTNDTEPNDGKTSAKNVNPYDTITGHVGYYYNLKRDTSDWYKVTLPGDGSLAIILDFPFQSGHKLQVTLFDNNGTTVINSDSSSQYFPLITHGLGAGTYYIKVNMLNANYYSYYTLRANHGPVVVPNNIEPNDNKSQAKLLNDNDSITGHINYYYNGKRDSSDWFKIVTTNDLTFLLTFYSGGQSTLWIDLFDTDGATILNQKSASAQTYVYLYGLGLKKGTYYARVRPDNFSEANYYHLTLGFGQSLPNDPEPNDYAKKGAVINGYTSKTGHVGHYGNGSYDSKDWWRIAFGGVGNLDLTYANTGLVGNTAIYKLYADTNAAPIDSQTIVNNYSHTYTGLTAGTYYINIIQIDTIWQNYTLTANYRDTTTATITLASSSGSAGNCGNHKLNYYVTRGLPPYSVQLYRNGVAYGSPVTTNDTAKFTSLTPDVYYAKVKSTGAVTTTTKSALKGQVTTVTGHISSNIQSTSAVVNWNAFTCVDGFRVSYKKTADAAFTLHTLAGGALVSDTLKNLLPSTSYEYKVQAYVQYNNVKYFSGFTTVKTFTTLAPRLGGDEVQQLAGEINNLLIYPNPAQNELNIQFEGMDGNASVKIIDLTGRRVMEKQAEVTLNQYSGTLDISNLQTGIYQLTITNADKKTISTKLVKQ